MFAGTRVASDALATAKIAEVFPPLAEEANAAARFEPPAIDAACEPVDAGHKSGAREKLVLRVCPDIYGKLEVFTGERIIVQASWGEGQDRLREIVDFYDFKNFDRVNHAEGAFLRVKTKHVEGIEIVNLPNTAEAVRSVLPPFVGAEAAGRIDSAASHYLFDRLRELQLFERLGEIIRTLFPKQPIEAEGPAARLHASFHSFIRDVRGQGQSTSFFAARHRLYGTISLSRDDAEGRVCWESDKSDSFSLEYQRRDGKELLVFDSGEEIEVTENLVAPGSPLVTALHARFNRTVEAERDASIVRATFTNFSGTRKFRAAA